MTENKIFKSIMTNYDSFKENLEQDTSIRHAQLLNYLRSLDKNILKIEKAGNSIEDREIFHIKIGSGKKDILMWTQMHGDEPTATLAVFDLINFLSSKDNFNEIIKKILSEVTLHIIPMLNPDGAEKFSRRNSIGIDINRDAVNLQSPEAKILMNIFNEVQPEFSFNLHDQDSGYSAGNNYKSATISLLAPPFDILESESIARENAMKICVDIFNELSNHIPGHVAKYDEEFEPRAFGDNFSKKGSSTILIEAGAWSNDPDKKFVRKIYFLALLKGILSISEKSYLSQNKAIYNSIPLNKELLFDLVLRNVILYGSASKYKVDIGIKREKIFDNRTDSFYYQGLIQDIGDLSIYYGYDDIELDGFEIVPGVIETLQVDISEIDPAEFLSKGILFLKYGKNQSNKRWTHLPLNFSDEDYSIIPDITTDNYANFLLMKDGKYEYFVVNGFLVNINNIQSFTGNGLFLG